MSILVYAGLLHFLAPEMLRRLRSSLSRPPASSSPIRVGLDSAITGVGPDSGVGPGSLGGTTPVIIPTRQSLGEAGAVWTSRQ